MAGLAFGSFITLVSYRLPRREDIFRRRSRCPACDTPLGMKDLVPVLSWLTQGGKCRYCESVISPRYPLIELLTGILFAWLYARYGLGAEGLLLALLGVCLLIMITTDMEYGILPDAVQIALVPLAIFYRAATNADWPDMLLGGALCLGIGLLLHYGYFFLRKCHGLGLGDVKLLAVAGLWLGVLPIVPFLFFAGVLGLLSATLWRIFIGGREFPFGPALAVSLYLCLLFPEYAAGFWNIGPLINQALGLR